MAGCACGIRAVERVDSEGDARFDGGEVADAEEVVRLFWREQRHRLGEHPDHLGLVFSDASSDGKAVEGKGGEVRAAFFSQIRVDASMDDGIHPLLLRVLEVGVERSLFPPVGSFEGGFEFFRVDVVGREFVEGDDDVGL